MEIEDYGQEQTNCLLRKDLKNLASKEGIMFSKALEFGVRFMLAEGDVIDYPICKLTKNLEKFMNLSNKLQDQINELEERIIKQNKSGNELNDLEILDELKEIKQNE